MSCCSNTFGMFPFVLFNNLGGMQQIEEQERETTEYENNHIIKFPENEKEFIEEYDNFIKEIDTQRQNNEECLAKKRNNEILKRATETHKLVVKKRENQNIETGKLKNQIIDTMINVKEKKLREVVTDEKTQSKMKETLSTNFEIMKKVIEGMKDNNKKPIQDEYFIKVLGIFTISQVKRLVKSVTGIPLEQQRLLYIGKQLEDQNTLLDCGITDELVIHLALRIRGGNPVILLCDNEKKKNEVVSMNIKFNEAMNVGATYPEIKTIEESDKIKECEWKGAYNSDGENNCRLTGDGKEVEYLFWEDIGINQQHFEDELSELLKRLGLNERERNDCIVYWITKLGKRKNYFVIICSRFDKVIAPLTVSRFEQIHRVMLKFEEIENLC
ncbi:hypothetical protein ENUP19_0018G0039 [Entamoeba nuttalli]|uniref:Ubiquitin-like domain-containing protein n=1 Tax=Entamoeba nuttalli TaxID=412467 RepID=A0ABQ0D8L9_9EUKA